MKINQQLLYVTLFFLCCSYNSYATVFNAIATGDWDEITTWDQGSVPGALDTVVVDGYAVTIDAATGDVTIKHLILTNYLGDSQLFIDGLVTLTVSDDVEATLENVEHNDIDLMVLNGAILNVGGNADFSRASDNNTNERLLLTIEDASRMNVSGGFTFDYKNAESTEIANEIFLDNTAILDVTGITRLYTRGGADFDFKIIGSAQAILRGGLNAQISGGNALTITSAATAHFQVLGNTTITNSGATTHAKVHADGTDGEFTFGGDLALNSTANDKIVFVEATNNDCVINVSGDVSMSALSEGDVYIDLKASSKMNLGGGFLRPTNYGALYMAGTATLTYNGSSAQVIAVENKAGSGTDVFNFTNVVLDNTSGFTVEDTLYIVDTLFLVDGIISTTSTNLIIISDQGVISGGSQSAYIDGPLIKAGRTNNAPFIFPIGDGSEYAPIEISKVSTVASQYEATYFGDPPPFGASLAADVKDIEDNGYWTLTKVAGSEDVNITLHWIDADAKGIDNLDSLIIVGLDSSNEWQNLGNGGTDGNVGAGNSGSISSVDGDPPPFGMTTFTFGTDPEPIALPAELIYFRAGIHKGKTKIKWRTAAEENVNRYEIQRSFDGIHFHEIGAVGSRGDSHGIQDYSLKDVSPGGGFNYYRLRIVDKNGRFEFSPVEVVNFETAQKIFLYPNPVDQMIHFKTDNSFMSEGTIEVFDLSGQRIYVGSCSFINGTYQISTNLVNANAPGSYVVRFTSETSSYVLKFNKVRN